MALLVSNTYPPPQVPNLAPYAIGREWCIGDSLNILNVNFANLDTRIETISTNFLSVSSHVYNFNVLDTPTINLTHILNTNTLSAEVINNSINTTKLGGDILQTGKAFLTSVSLTALRDVVVSNLSGGQVLGWSSTFNRWQNISVGGGGGGGLVLIPGTDYGDIVIGQDGSWLLDTTPGQEAVTTAAIRNNAVTREKLTTGAPYWLGNTFFGVNNATPLSQFVVGPSFTTGYSELFSINGGQLGVTANTVLNLASIGFRSNLANLNFSIKGKRVVTGQGSDTAAVGISYDVDNDSYAQMWLTRENRVGILTDRPNHTLTVIGTISAAEVLSNTFTGTATRALNLSGGGVNRIPYQTDTTTTAFIPAGTQGQVLLAGVGGTPNWANTNSFVVQTASNLAGGGAGQVAYQTGLSATGFTAAGTSGQILRSSGAGAPVWIDQSAIVAGSAGSASNLSIGVANENRIVYQAGVGSSATVAQGTTGQVLVGNTNAAPTWALATSLTVGTANAVGSKAVGNAGLRDSTGTSVIGRAESSTGQPGDISTTTDGHILRRSGGTLGFGTITSTGIADGAVGANQLAGSAVTEAKISDGAVTSAKIGSGAVSTTKLDATLQSRITGAGNIIEFISTVCDGSNIPTRSGATLVIPNIFAKQAVLTTTYENIPASTVTYTPPTGTKVVTYRFTWFSGGTDTDAILHYRFYISGQEVTSARFTTRGGSARQIREIFEWPIVIGTNDISRGKVQDWTSGRELKLMARAYNGSYQGELHVTRNWDGGAAEIFSAPLISIIATT